MYIDINAAGCSDTCRHCSVDGHAPYGEYYSLSDLRLIKNEWGPLTIRFEPTAHPDFPEIFNPDIAGDHGGWLVTNGFGLAHRDDYPLVFEKMRQMGMATISFTFHGLEEHHDWFVCRQGAYDTIVTATKRARQFGFSTRWQFFVDKISINDVPKFIELALKETGALPSLEIPYHRVGGRLWHYEKIRLTLSDVEKYRLHQLMDDPGKNYLRDPENLTSRVWLRKWTDNPSDENYKHLFEPQSWPPQDSFPNLSMRIDRNRKVFIDPICWSPIYLGNLSDGKKAIIEKMERLAAPLYCDLKPDCVNLLPEEQEQLHPTGFSLRYKEISKKRIIKVGAGH